MIDEYQDTNTAQYEIIKLLGAMHENVCVVGDDAQSIYSFRGATIETFYSFKRLRRSKSGKTGTKLPQHQKHFKCGQPGYWQQ
ncbi:MAG: UvrD-helicase domain-containing protein [Ferruginibacter sp.]